MISTASKTPVGCLVLVVGPSGAGKDTLLDGARDILGGETRIHFVRRTITRPAAVGEDHRPMTSKAFDRAAADGAFALHWQAHGLRYGLPADINAWLAAGDVVVANGSRAILAEAAKQFARLQVVNIVASPEILAMRLAGRGRESSDGQQSRLARSAAIVADLTKAHTIDNSGPVEVGTAALSAFIRQLLPGRAQEQEQQD